MSATSTDEIPIGQWGRRLTDAVRAAIAAHDTALALDLVRNGDGQTRSLAKEYSMMFAGLTDTVRIIVDLLDGLPTATGVGLFREFRISYSETVSTVLTDCSTLPTLTESLAGSDAQACQDVLVLAGQQFGVEQEILARKVEQCLELGDLAGTLELIDYKESGQFKPLHDQLVGMVAGSFASVLHDGGPDTLLDFEMRVADRQRRGMDAWEVLTPRDFARTFTFILKQHVGTVEVHEQSDRFVLEQERCGSGGMLIAQGAYEGDQALPVIEGHDQLTGGRDSLPVYCTHCSVWNGVVPTLWYGHPHVIQADPARADGGCTLHILKQRSPEREAK